MAFLFLRGLFDEVVGSSEGGEIVTLISNNTKNTYRTTKCAVLRDIYFSIVSSLCLAGLLAFFELIQLMDGQTVSSFDHQLSCNSHITSHISHVSQSH